MRGDVVYRVYARHEGREKDYYFGAFHSRSVADSRIAQLRTVEMNERNWAEQYHNRGFVVRETAVDTDFEIPPLPKPRDRYAVKCTPKSNGPEVVGSTIVAVARRSGSPAVLEEICEYERNYDLLQTFEPFRQGDKNFALVSRDYTRTAVLDLASGEVIAEEIDAPRGALAGSGFCPVGFYVPDWWDLHEGSVIPGCEYWSTDYEWPVGHFGFVWGCIWGDDNSWKVQYLDLSRIQQGVICRDARFGYVELATAGYTSPCLSAGAAVSGKTAPPHFINVSKRNGVTRVTFAVEMGFELDSGKAEEWQRRSHINLE
jgi:hypothetical protein